jgi:hypothetical protein
MKRTWKGNNPYTSGNSDDTRKQYLVRYNIYMYCLFLQRNRVTKEESIAELSTLQPTQIIEISDALLHHHAVFSCNNLWVSFSLESVTTIFVSCWYWNFGFVWFDENLCCTIIYLYSPDNCVVWFWSILRNLYWESIIIDSFLQFFLIWSLFHSFVKINKCPLLCQNIK